MSKDCSARNLSVYRTQCFLVLGIFLNVNTQPGFSSNRWLKMDEVIMFAAFINFSSFWLPLKTKRTFQTVKFVKNWLVLKSCNWVCPACVAVGRRQLCFCHVAADLCGLIHAEVGKLHLVNGNGSTLALAVTWWNGSGRAGRGSGQERDKTEPSSSPLVIIMTARCSQRHLSVSSPDCDLKYLI